MQITYRHEFIDGPAKLAPGKVVCVGRNYAAHARELENPVPTAPLLFMKPSTAFAPLEKPIALPHYANVCHYELELAVLLSTSLTRVDAKKAKSSVCGYALALDLTLRELQNRLKSQGHPWEMAKSFDASCPISPFVRKSEIPDVQNVELTLSINEEIRQNGNTSAMSMGVFDLIAYISDYFTLLPGDVVLTGTPPGVGSLNPGDRLIMELANRYRFETSIMS